MPGDRVLDEIEKLIEALSALDSLPDALIVSDPGVIMMCRQHLGSIPLHLSTQTGTCNYLSARFWQGQGITRIVLPREMTLEEVAAFNKKVTVETELFVHGAMCVSISGRCLLGAYLGGRHGHANRGDCPQPCRLDGSNSCCPAPASGRCAPRSWPGSGPKSTRTWRSVIMGTWKGSRSIR